MNFWSKVDMRGPDVCWRWTGTPGVWGYGKYKEDGQTLRAHRVAYELAKGAIGDLLVMHLCNNKMCCNPDHLELGTTQDNSAMAKKDGLYAAGERQHLSKLTVAQVYEIRERKKNGESDNALGREFGVTGHSIYAIAKGITWKHLPL